MQYVIIPIIVISFIVAVPAKIKQSRERRTNSIEMLRIAAAEAAQDCSTTDYTQVFAELVGE